MFSKYLIRAMILFSISGTLMVYSIYLIWTKLDPKIPRIGVIVEIIHEPTYCVYVSSIKDGKSSIAAIDSCNKFSVGDSITLGNGN